MRGGFSFQKGFEQAYDICTRATSKNLGMISKESANVPASYYEALSIITRNMTSYLTSVKSLRSGREIVQYFGIQVSIELTGSLVAAV